MEYRKRLTKKQRQVVYDKYGGRCAYCGEKITLKEMQADHIYSVFHAKWFENVTPEELNSLDNFRPACRMCNYYKNVCSTDGFKSNIKQMLWANLRKTFAYKLLLKYNLIVENDHEITFLFEEKERENETDLHTQRQG